MTRRFRIGDRVQLSDRFKQAHGTVFANPYKFGGVIKVGVVWDAHPKRMMSADASALRLVKVKKAAARVYSCGALASPERRFA